MSINPTTDAIVRLFNRTFSVSENTVLVSGGAEPLYLPAASGRSHHEIIFSHDYPRSALHEVAHWCVAGKVRRHLVDYGYWYAPDGRDGEQQARFEKFEIKPQAYEWLLCLSAGLPFEVSLDNLHASEQVQQRLLVFTEHVSEFGEALLQKGLPVRLALFCEALQSHFKHPTLTAERVRTAGEQLRRAAAMRISYLEAS